MDTIKMAICAFAGRVRWRLCVWVMALVPFVAGCGEPSAEVRESNEKGLLEYQAGNYPEAIACFKRAAELDRERPEASVYIADCELAMARERFRDGNLPGALRETDRAISSYDMAIAAFPGYSRAVQGKSDALKLRGLHAAAMQLAEWAAENSGPQSNKLTIKGREYSQVGEIDKAELALKQAVAIEPENPVAHAELGLFYMRMGNRSQAETSLKRAYELNPRAPGVLEALSQLGVLSELPFPRGQ